MESTCVITYGLGAIAAGQTPHVTWLVMLPLSSARVARFFFEGGEGVIFCLLVILAIFISC